VDKYFSQNESTPAVLNPLNSETILLNTRTKESKGTGKVQNGKSSYDTKLQRLSWNYWMWMCWGLFL